MPAIRGVPGYLLSMFLLGAVPGAAQDTPERQIDRNLLTPHVVKIDCDFRTYPQANDCVRRILPTVSLRASDFLKNEATFLLRVTYRKFPDANNANQPIVSSGSAYLVDRDRGFFLTAKHVLMGPKDWPSTLQAGNFSDFEAAVENYLGSQDVQISLQANEDGVPIAASLIAMDRTSDLALIAVRNPNLIPLSQFPALFQNPPIAADVDCNGLKVRAIGFGRSPDAKKFERKSTSYESASCDYFSKTYLIGGLKYNIPLFRSSTAFQPGFSGGPVLDEDYRLVGIVSGAVPALAGEPKDVFFVPISIVKAFLAKFR